MLLLMTTASSHIMSFNGFPCLFLSSFSFQMATRGADLKCYVGRAKLSATGYLEQTK